jgi:Tfp pilus assembly major pilin PilA
VSSVLSRSLIILALAVIVILLIGLRKYRTVETRSDAKTETTNKEKSKNEKTECAD